MWFFQIIMFDFYGVLEKSMNHKLKVPEIFPILGLCNQIGNNVDFMVILAIKFFYRFIYHVATNQFEVELHFVS